MNSQNRMEKGCLWETNSPESSALNELLWGVVLLLGGTLVVSVLLITQANLNSITIWNVLFPGCAIGLLLMFAGWFGMSKSKSH